MYATLLEGKEEVAERSKAADCKSVSLYSRWFESNLSHIFLNTSYDKSSSYYVGISPCLQLNKKPAKLVLKRLSKNFSPDKFLIKSKSNTGHYTILKTNVETTDFVLNFKRLRFFPLARPHTSGDTIFTTSLGCIAKFLNKGKSHTKKKAVFLLVASLLRKILLYTGLSDMHLYVNRIPLYFQEILNQIYTPTKSLYYHPFFQQKLVDESDDNIKSFDFKYVSFTNTKSYGYIKWKKKGRLKRKITKRVFSINRVID